jgi:MFS family permease
MSEHIISFLMPTIVVYMIERLGGYNTSNPDEIQTVSIWVGLLEGGNRLFALFGGISWGMISDRIGRKKSLLMILIGVSISSLGIGLSTSLYTVLLWRVVGGFLAGTIPITKALMRDLSDDSNLSILYSYFGTGYGAASILGPLFGGLFSNPDIFPLKWFFNTFPYFLPFFLQ